MNQNIFDLQLLEMILSRPGATDSELGTALGRSRISISRKRNDPAFKAMLREHFEKSFKLFEVARTKAVLRIIDAIDSADERIALKASALVCELVTVSPPEESQDQKRARGESTARSLLEKIRRQKSGSD